LASLEEFCKIEGSMTPRMLGHMPAGTRIDFAFDGTATSPHWEGERPLRGVDYVTVRKDGNMDLDIRATIGEKRETVAYQELLTFQTGNEDLAWLNTAVGVALGTGGQDLTLTVYIIKS
jgi:hypothetical protein